jgi:flagellar capping protein FliD
VSQTPNAVRDALSAFATAFNAAVDEVDLHRGEDAGALAGNSLLSDLSRTLRTIARYDSGGTGINTLESLGLTFDQFGHLNFDESTFDTVAPGQLDGLIAFLGSASTGGFLQAATNEFDNLEDPLEGLIDSAIKTVNEQISRQDTRIAENQARIDLMRETLTAKIAAADALIAQMEQQVTLFNGLFQAMRSSNDS